MRIVADSRMRTRRIERDGRGAAFPSESNREVASHVVATPHFVRSTHGVETRGSRASRGYFHFFFHFLGGGLV